MMLEVHNRMLVRTMLLKGWVRHRSTQQVRGKRMSQVDARCPDGDTQTAALLRLHRIKRWAIW